MKGSDRTILLVIPLLALAVGFYMLAISPKRSESSDLQERIDSLNASIEASEAEIAAAEAAREGFPESYGRLVTLGRAVPEDGDQATFIFDMAGLGKRNDVEFRDFTVASGGAEAQPAPAPAAPEEEDSEEESPEGGEDSAEAPAPAPAVATEATAATLPIGATIGSAGLPVVPYEFRFLGNFFDMASFFHDIDTSVTVSEKSGKPKVSGRLVTIDSFELTGDPSSGFPDIEARFNVTTYVVPPDQGLSAGATPAGPAPAVSPAAPTPVSTPEATP